MTDEKQREEMLKSVRTILPADRILTAEPMRDHTTFRIGGPAAYFLRIVSERELAGVLSCFKRTGFPFFVLGNGSNLLVSDRGYEGVVLWLGRGFDDIRREGDRLIARAGALLSQTAREACRHGLSGLEFATGIPGSVGGALVMNAGAYGGEMAQVTQSVRVMDHDGRIFSLHNAGMEFGYRSSRVSRENLIVLEATFLLRPGEPDRIQETMDEFSNRRREKQPLAYPSAGSTFKRPEGDYAGRLIMESKLAGFSIGGAQVSEQHCGFIINRHEASAADVRGVIDTVQSRVMEQFGIWLEPEVIFLGDF